MKIAAGIIVFNSDFVLKQVIKSIYPYMSQILISEGCVKYWADKGYKTSTDKTNEILASIKDPEKKIKIIHGVYAEKTEQANAYIKYVAPDTDYVWNIDADEVFKPRDIVHIISKLSHNNYTSVGFKSYSFYGGFNHYLTGFEQEHEFIRIQKYHPGAMWSNHRPPTILQPEGQKRHLGYDQLAAEGIFMYHYSYVFPRQVKEKISYYENSVIQQGSCIPDYFTEVYLKWVNGNPKERNEIEKKYKGVHEFQPHVRGECYTKVFEGEHPEIIQEAMPAMLKEWAKQLRICTPINPEHKNKLEKLYSSVTFYPGSFDKKFVKDLAFTNSALTEKQAAILEKIFYKYRVQLKKSYPNEVFVKPSVAAEKVNYTINEKK